MTSLQYRPWVQTTLAPGNPDNGHGGLTLDVLGGGDPTSGSGAITGTSALAVAFVDTTSGYTFSAAHQWVSDLGANVVAGGIATGTGGDDRGELQNVRFVNAGTAGVAVDANDFTVTGMGDGTQSVNALALYFLISNSGDENPLLAYIDTGTGFGFTPFSSTVTVTWDSGTNRIFSVGA